MPRVRGPVCFTGALLMVVAMGACATGEPRAPGDSTEASSSVGGPSPGPACLDVPGIAALIGSWETKGDDFNTMIAGTLEELSTRAARATAAFPHVAAAFRNAARAYAKGDAAWRGRYWEKDLFEAKEMLARGAASFAHAAELCTAS